MGLKRAENQVKILLQETIIALCRNTLNSYGEVCVEGLLGVTLDNEEIFLVSINEMFNNPDVAKKLKKNLKRSKEAGDGSDSETEHSDGDDHGDAPKKRKKKRPRKKKKKGDSATTGSGGSGEESGSSTDQDDNDDNTETEANTTQDDHTNNHTDQMNPPHLNIAPEPSNRSSTADHDHRNTKSEEEDSNDLQKIKIKEELEDEDDDEDLVFVKEEIGDSSFNQNQYSNYSSDGQMYMPPGGMHSGQGGLMQMPGQSNVSGNQYSQDFMGDMSNMSNISQGSDSQMMGFSQGQQNMSFTGASPVAGPSSASGLMMWPFGAVTAAASDSSVDPRSICPICGVRLAHANNLKRHIRIHTGHRPYGCSRCGKRFTQSNALKKHELTHIKQDNLDPLNASRAPIQALSTTCPTTSNVTTPPGMKLNISVTNAVANAIRNPNAVPDESVAMRAPYMLGNLPDRALPFNMMWSALPFAFNPPEKSEKRSDIEDNDDDNDNDDSGDDDNNMNDDGDKNINDDDDKNINDADDNVSDKDHDDDKNASSDLDEIDKYIFSNKADDKDNL